MKILKILPLLLALLLTACAADPIGETTLPEAPPSTGAETLPEDTALPAIAETIPPEELLHSVNPLTNQVFCMSPSVAVLDERTAAFLTTQYDKERAITVTHLLTMDLYTDTVIAQTTMDCALSLPVQSRLPGVLPVYDISGHRWLILSRELELLSDFPCEKSGGVFDASLSAYYFVRAQRLCRMDLASGEIRELETGLTLPVDSIIDYRMEDNVVLVNVHTQYYLTDLCLGAVDLEDGTLLMLTDDAHKGFFTPEGILLQSGDSLTSADLTLTDWTRTEGTLLEAVLPGSNVHRSWCIPQSDYHLSLHYDSHTYKLDSFLLYRFGKTYESCQLYDLTDGLDPDKLVSLPGGNLLAVEYNRRGTRLALICPDKLTFTEAGEPGSRTVTLVDDAIVESYTQQSAPVEVPEALADVRAQADALEEKYDITILLSNQCDSIIEQCGFTLQPTDQAALAREASLLCAALEDLDEAMALYPADFFPQFRNEAHERGILVLLVENITTGIQDSNVDVLGVTYDMGDWYPIAVDITTDNLPATYCHEIWHAMENKIMDEDPMLFNDVAWGKLNPKGFAYQGVRDGYYFDTEHTFVEAKAGKKSYFVDAYGKTIPQEDRARLMEYMMTTDFLARKMMQSPVLYQKMEIMILAVREIFDTNGWESVYWERYYTPETTSP